MSGDEGVIECRVLGEAEDWNLFFVYGPSYRSQRKSFWGYLTDKIMACGGHGGFLGTLIPLLVAMKSSEVNPTKII